MKTSYYLAIFIFIKVSILHAQCDQPITLLSQAEVDAFASNHCEVLQGTLTIGPTDVNEDCDIHNLDSLISLTRVEGSIRIFNCDSLISISGLSNVETVTISINITDCDKLTNVDGLQGITELSRLNLNGNGSLENVDALTNLNFLSSDLGISQNKSLLNLDGLSGLEIIENALNITNNESLIQIDSLYNLKEVGWSILIKNNENLQTVEGLTGLTKINWGINISENGVLNLDGLRNVSRIEHSLFLDRNRSMISIEGLSNLNFIGEDLYLGQNDALQNLNGLEGIERLDDGFIEIEFNDVLEDVSGLGNLIFVDQGITIQSNPLLADCCPLFPLLDEHTSFIDIENNKDGCDSFSEIDLNCNPLSTTEVVAEYSIFPNPSYDEIRIVTSQQEDIDLTIMDAFGKEVLTVQNAKSPYSISDLSPALYIICLKTSKGISTVKHLVLSH